jgi:hypothetical protein
VITPIVAFPSESNGQLLSINGKTEDDILRSLDRALVTMRTTPERKVLVLDSIFAAYMSVSNFIFFTQTTDVIDSSDVPGMPLLHT